MEALMKKLAPLMHEIEQLIDRLPIFIGRLERFLKQLVQAPKVLWKGSADSLGDRILLIMFMIGFAAAAVYLLVNFLKASWREKLRMLLTGCLAVVVLLVIFYFALM